MTQETDRREVLVSRVLTVCWGAVATALAFVVGQIGVISIISKALSGFFGGVLLGVFLLGILSPRANAPGATAGGLIGFATICAVGLATPVNFFWYAPVGCCSTFIAGMLASRIFASPPPDKVEGLTLATAK